MDTDTKEKPIPNFLARETNPKLFSEIIRKHPAVKMALSEFKREFRLPGCKKKLTVSRMNERLITWSGSEPVFEKYLFKEGHETSIVGQIFILGRGESENKDTAIIKSTKKFHVIRGFNHPDLVRDLLCYDGTAFTWDKYSINRAGKEVTSILVLFALELNEPEIIATLYLPPENNWLSEFLKNLDSVYFDYCRGLQDDRLLGIQRNYNPTGHEVAEWAELRRRQRKKI